MITIPRSLVAALTALLISAINISSTSCTENEISHLPPEPYTGKAYIIMLSHETDPSLPLNYDDLSRFHFFGICWNGNNDDNLKFAKQMGYRYIMYKTGMENSALAKDLYFYIESPDYHVYTTLGIDRSLQVNKAYSEAQKTTYQQYFALKISDAVFPGNMATGWATTGGFSVEPDWQQQKVIDYFVNQVKLYAKDKERPDKNFHFGGLTWDVPQFTGDFWGGGKQVSLAYWNGVDSSALFNGNTHEYKTYSEGKSSYYLTIKQTLKNEYPARKLLFVFEPYHFYDSWFKGMEKLVHENQVLLMENSMMTQEAGVTQWSTGTEFVDDARVFSSGLFSKDHSGSSTPDNHDLTKNKLIAGKAAVNGSWFNWYGRFSGSGDKVPMKNIYEVPNWLQLIRVAGNWDNLNGVPLSERKWDGAAYNSTNTRIDTNVIFSRQPKTKKLFVVFLNASGEVNLKPGEKIVSVKRVDKYFIETVDGRNDLVIDGNKIRLKN